MSTQDLPAAALGGTTSTSSTTTSTSNKRPKDDIALSLVELKKTKLGHPNPNPTTSAPQDVRVKVGDKAFLCSSHLLKGISDYFADIPANGCFEFPDRKPEEWDLILQVIAGTVKIDSSNWEIVLSWFQELKIKTGLESCDNALVQMLKESSFTWMDDCCGCRAKGKFCPYVNRRAVHQVLEFLDKAMEANLKKTKAVCFQLLHRLLQEIPSLLTQCCWATICTLLKDHSDFKQEFWEKVQSFLPAVIVQEATKDKCCATKNINNLLDNPLISSVIYMEQQRTAKEAALQMITQKILAAKDQHEKDTATNELNLMLTQKGLMALEKINQKGKYHIWSNE